MWREMERFDDERYLTLGDCRCGEASKALLIVLIEEGLVPRLGGLSSACLQGRRLLLCHVGPQEVRHGQEAFECMVVSPCTV